MIRDRCILLAFFHSAGGGYLYVKTGLKDPQGFMSGWMAWFAYVVALLFLLVRPEGLFGEKIIERV